ncbi:hypothetical protein ACRBEV_21230 [Methylobacterium phyllosphaerae]
MRRFFIDTFGYAGSDRRFLRSLHAGTAAGPAAAARRRPGSGPAA